ncbi:MAG TPA: hypothetical protein VFC98_00855 [Clostridia bacterium]|nr:hypothetical protein [Clostridia bacterium]
MKYVKRIEKIINEQNGSLLSSDLDIMVSVDMDEGEINKKRDEVLDMVVNLTTRYGIVLSIIENNYDYFYDWAKALPFFTNVIKEGVNIYER